jgi:hypothetical protein
MEVIKEWILVGAGLAIGRLLVAGAACILTLLVLFILYWIFYWTMGFIIWMKDRKRRKQNETMDQ